MSVKSNLGTQLLRRGWIGGVIVLVCALAAVCLGRIGTMYYQSANGKPSPHNSGDVVRFNPKRITFELDGDFGGGGQATYLDVDAQPHEVTLDALPWSRTQTTTLTSVAASIVAKVQGGRLTCRILVDGQVRSESSLTEDGSAVSCTVLSA